MIALAKKDLNINYENIKYIERDKIEKNISFLGLIVMENRLKPQTKPVIKLLKKVNIRTIMCTGDNILTALSVARDCSMINEDEKIIIVEAKQNEPVRFTYAHFANRKIKDMEYDSMVDIFY